ncbi:PTS system mannose/fructose/sorbose family transporter subunit IID [candidate division KSB1 bacterium]|nr:PTS system mannose/fructose/sorbose family transporter subunit IID [candidate division KSB1 bacterium]
MVKTKYPLSKESSESGIITKLDFFKIFVRSFFIQACFTYKYMLGTGFGFTLLPGIRRMAKNSEDIGKILSRNSRFFNTHPYLSSYVIGSILRIEEKSQTESVEESQDKEKIKQRLSTILGSLGDRLFWKYLKAWVSVIALIVIFAYQSNDNWNYYAGVTSFIVIFNIFHLFYRWRGLKEGYKMETMVIQSKSIIIIEKMNKFISNSTLVLIGILIIVEINYIFSNSIIGAAILILAGFSTFYFSFRKISPAMGIISGQIIAIILYFVAKILP